MGFPADFATKSGKEVGKEEPMESAPDPFFVVIVLIIFPSSAAPQQKWIKAPAGMNFLCLCMNLNVKLKLINPDYYCDMGIPPL